jgi:hypothetical protein
MRELAFELLEPLLVVFYGAIVAVLAAIGVGAELAGIAGLSGGVSTVSLWLVYVGAIGMVAATVVARRRLAPSLAALR